jgi:hypothetical protein
MGQRLLSSDKSFAVINARGRTSKLEYRGDYLPTAIRLRVERRRVTANSASESTAWRAGGKGNGDFADTFYIRRATVADAPQAAALVTQARCTCCLEGSSVVIH